MMTERFPSIYPLTSPEMIGKEQKRTVLKPFQFRKKEVRFPNCVSI